MNKPIEYNTTQLKPYQSDRVNSQSNQNRNLQNELSLPSISPVRQQVNEALSHWKKYWLKTLIIGQNN